MCRTTSKLIIGLVILSLNGCQQPETSEMVEEIIRPVRAMTVIPHTQSNDATFSGIVRASKQSQLSFRVAGNVKSLKVKIGSRVKKDALLAELDQTDYNIEYNRALANQKNSQAAMLSAKAAINRAESERIRAKAAYDRAQRLFETNSIAVSEFEQARAAAQAAEANTRSANLQYSSAQAQYNASVQQTNSAKNQLSYTELRAPFAGVISQIMIEESEQFSAGRSAMILSTDQKAEIEVGLPANVISQVKTGDKVTVTFFNIKGKRFQGEVTEVGFSTNSSAVYPLIVQLQQNAATILPGMSAEVAFNLSQTNTAQFITVPASAVGDDNQGKYVYLLNQKTGDGSLYDVVRQSVAIGQLDSLGFQIIDGLETGALIATAGLNSLQQGDVVTLLKTKN